MSQANKPLKGAFLNPHNYMNNANPTMLSSPNNNSHTNYSPSMGQQAQQQLQQQQQQQQQVSQGQYKNNQLEDLGLHRTQMKSTTVDRLSKVLLVIFSNNEIKSNQDLFDLFSPFVRVIRVLIFERKEPNVKCFIEMMSLQEATYVKNQFSFQKAKNPNKNTLQIYYAQIQTIDLQNHYSEGQDFTSFYAKNPMYPCQYFTDCEQSQLQQTFSNVQPKYFQPPSNNPSFNAINNNNNNNNNNNQNTNKAVFGQPPYINSQQYIPSQALSELDNTFDQNNLYFEGGIRPSSVSSINFSHQQQMQQQQQQQQQQYGNSGIPLSHFSKGANRHTLHANPMSSNLPIASYESKVYAHFPSNSNSNNNNNNNSNNNNPNHSVDKQSRNVHPAAADQFHKDFIKQDNILQNHINQQFHHQSHLKQLAMQQQQSQQQSSQLLSPVYKLKADQFGGGTGASQPSSSIRSPSSTQYSLNHPNDLSDVDENVSACHPSAFMTRYRDDLFFNGGNNMYSSEELPPGITTEPQQQYSNNYGVDEDGAEAKRVLFVRHLDHPELKITMIYNLFSNYGNIAKILFMKQKRQALIEFETVQQAFAAREYLNNLLYYSAQMKVDFSKYDQIDLQRKKLYSGESNDQEQVLSIPAQCYRYKLAKMIPSYAPKHTLHVSNIRKEYFVYELLMEFFSQNGAKITMLKLIPNEKKQMCLIQFESLDDALRILSTFHDFPFHGRNLCISFTKNTNNPNVPIPVQLNQPSQQIKQIEQSVSQEGKGISYYMSMNNHHNQIGNGGNNAATAQRPAYVEANNPNTYRHYNNNDYYDNYSDEESLEQDVKKQILNLGI